MLVGGEDVDAAQGGAVPRPAEVDRRCKGSGREPGGIEKLEGGGTLGYGGNHHIQAFDGLTRRGRRARFQPQRARCCGEFLGARECPAAGDYAAQPGQHQAHRIEVAVSLHAASDEPDRLAVGAGEGLRRNRRHRARARGGNPVAAHDGKGHAGFHVREDDEAADRRSRRLCGGHEAEPFHPGIAGRLQHCGFGLEDVAGSERQYGLGGGAGGAPGLLCEGLCNHFAKAVERNRGACDFCF